MSCGFTATASAQRAVSISTNAAGVNNAKPSKGRHRRNRRWRKCDDLPGYRLLFRHPAIYAGCPSLPVARTDALVKTLLLMRHGDADPPGLGGGDFERDLSLTGREQCGVIARQLHDRNLQPDAILSSSARRAAATAKEIAEQLGFPDSHLEFREQIYAAEGTTLLELVQGIYDGHHVVVLVGHNPGISTLGALLADPRGLRLATGNVAVLTIETDRWAEVGRGTATIQEQLLP